MQLHVPLLQGAVDRAVRPDGPRRGSEAQAAPHHGGFIGGISSHGEGVPVQSVHRPVHRPVKRPVKRPVERRVLQPERDDDGQSVKEKRKLHQEEAAHQKNIGRGRRRRRGRRRGRGGRDIVHHRGEVRRAGDRDGREDGETAVLYDAAEAAAAEAAGVDRSTLFHLPEDDKATELVWGEVVRAMDAGAWEEARAAKKAVENGERVERRRRATEGERWMPKIFQWDAAAATWQALPIHPNTVKLRLGLRGVWFNKLVKRLKQFQIDAALTRPFHPAPPTLAETCIIHHHVYNSISRRLLSLANERATPGRPCDVDA